MNSRFVGVAKTVMAMISILENRKKAVLKALL